MKTYKGTCSGDMDWQVTVDGVPLNPRYDLRNHSPDGFAWGYSGSGPAQLALAILADCVGDYEAQKHYQEFKAAYVSKLDMRSGFEITSDKVIEFLHGN